MEKNLISIIIPVYNTEQYLAECLESVINQTYDNIEIIVVNDGSSDNSNAIIAEYGEKCHKLKYVYQRNQGLSSARNAGIAMAKGEWLSFVDSDDYIEPNMLNDMIGIALKEQTDIVVCNFNFDNKPHYSPELSYCVWDINDLNSFLKDNYLQYKSSVCLKLIKKSLVADSIRFVDKKIMPEEDMLFSLKLLSRAKRVVFSNECYYHYRTRKGSITHTYQDNIDFVDKMVFKVPLLQQYFQLEGVRDDLCSFYAYQFISSLSSGINNLKTINIPLIYKLTKEIINKYSGRMYCKFIAIKGITIKGIPNSYKIYFRIMCAFLYLHFFFMGSLFLYLRAKRLRINRSKGANIYD